MMINRVGGWWEPIRNPINNAQCTFDTCQIGILVKENTCPPYPANTRGCGGGGVDICQCTSVNLLFTRVPNNHTACNVR